MQKDSFAKPDDPMAKNFDLRGGGARQSYRGVKGWPVDFPALAPRSIRFMNAPHSRQLDVNTVHAWVLEAGCEYAFY